MLDLLLITGLGFLGSFGHCLSMCGPITIALSLSDTSEFSSRWYHLRFHLLLNLGRILSYALVGSGIGALGSVLVAGGQMAGVGSPLRQGIAIAAGLLLIWIGLTHIRPQGLPQVPFLNPMAQLGLHDRLNRVMRSLSLNPHSWTPLFLGLAWGFIPCGFLYAAQLKAAETTSLWWGGATMLAFGLGTLPMIFGVGVSTSFVSVDRRGQLFRLGGWITVIIGVLTVFRSGNMIDFTGHASLICLMLALIARPVSRLWLPLLQYRRFLGVGALLLAVTHVAHMLVMGWNLAAITFLLPNLQVGAWAGILAIGMLLPLALTSFDQAQLWLAHRWRQLHLLSVPTFGLAVLHAILLGSSYLGDFEAATSNYLATIGLSGVAIAILLIRWRFIWSLLSLGKLYAPSKH